ISPCVTFNNHDTSTKSYTWGKEHQISLQELNYVPNSEEIEIDDYDDELEVQMHDGSWIVLKKLGDDYDPTDKDAAYRVLGEARREQKVLAGLLYVNEGQPDGNELPNTVDTPRPTLPAETLRATPASLGQIMA